MTIFANSLSIRQNDTGAPSYIFDSTARLNLIILFVANMDPSHSQEHGNPRGTVSIRPSDYSSIL